MLLPNQKIEINVKRANVRFYKDKYKCKVGDVIYVLPEDLSNGSTTRVGVICDYCYKKGIETVIFKEYSSYLKGREIVQKDCCTKCQGEKEKECNLK